jgi:hypothetical protein
VGLILDTISIGPFRACEVQKNRLAVFTDHANGLRRRVTTLGDDADLVPSMGQKFLSCLLEEQAIGNYDGTS